MTPRFFIPLLPAAVLACLPLAVSGGDATEQAPPGEAEIQPWVRELSAIDATRRAKYISYIMLAKNSFQQGQWMECLSSLNAAEAIFSGNPNVLNLRGACHTELRCYEDAARELEEALRQMPGDPATMMNLTTLDMKRSLWKECVERLNRLLGQLPAGTPPELADILRFRLYIALLKLDRREEAERIAEKADPLADSPFYYCALAAKAYAAGDDETGNKNMETASRIFRDAPVMQTYRKTMADAGLIHPIG